MIQSKISNFTFEDITRELGKGNFSMPVDTSDALRSCPNEYQFERAKKELMDRYGDVVVTIDKDQPWYDQVKVVDKKFIEMQNDYMRGKAAWCAKYGCD